MRSFNGRQSEELMNSELYKLFEVLKHIIDVPVESTATPTTEREGALWLDRQGTNASLKYFEEGSWKTVFQDKFKMMGDILASTQPDTPVPGQLWINDGILMYFTGSEWMPVKSVNVDTEFNISSFEQFLVINPIEASGSPVIAYKDIDGDGTPETIYYSQFLLPSVELDRFFINGLNTTDYEAVSNVALQYDSSMLVGKFASAVHMNPSKLVGMTKKFIYFDKLNPVIQVPELHTEYYGFRGGLGKLLLKSSDSSTEYVSTPEGIQLSPVAAAVYDYVVAISYQFKEVKNPGSLDKRLLVMGGSDSIFIGNIADKIVVFVSGMYLSEDSNQYQYDPITGCLTVPLETKMDVGAIAFSFVEDGVIDTIDGLGNGVVNTLHTYNQPIVFIHGETLQPLADFTIGTGVDVGKIFIKNAVAGMSYAVVETMGDLDDAKMFVKSGKLTGSSLDCTFAEIPGSNKVILFLNGLLIAAEDITRDSLTGEITVNGMVNNMEYLLLQDPSSRLLYNGQVNFITVPTELMDEALIYINNQLVCDSAAVFTTSLPTNAAQGEVKLLINGLSSKWYKFIGGQGWVEITNQTQIDGLAASALGYSIGRRSVSFLQNYGTTNGICYAYRFANAVQEALLRGTIKTNASEAVYNVSFSHTYPVGKNAVSVWINGVRQYPNTSLDLDNIDGIYEVDYGRIELPNPVAGNLFYVIEKPERDEGKSCQREVLTLANRVDGTSGVYKTSIPLYPGNLRVFVGGLRIIPSNYSIIDNYTLMIKSPIIGSMNNFPIEDVIIDGKVVQVNHEVYDKILVEVRQDYGLREVTIPVRYAGQKEFSLAAVNTEDLTQGGDALPRSLLDSKDFIMIYINGLAYGKEYVVDQIRQSIILTNDVVTSCLGTDYLQQYFSANPDKYLEWQAKNGNNPYVPKKNNDKITFEWR